MNTVDKEYIEVEYSIEELLNLALENDINMPLDFTLNADVVDVDDQHPLVVGLSDAKHHIEMLSHFIMDNSLDCDVHSIIEFEKVLEKLRKMTIANRGKQHRKTLDAFFLHVVKTSY